ncbi:MAG: plasmid recombination protein [Clostridia bacterium]|nr:plasmid recombination protein [Clostridia bacterium]
MSYAIIRNVKYKRANLTLAYRHNERKNSHYSNKNIDKSRTYLNYHLKEPMQSYEKEFERIRKEHNLKGQIKDVSNIACEYIITSGKEFFEQIGEEETKRYFKTAYDFVCEYKDLGEQNILSAVVHMDEETPHMHLVFIPVVHTLNKQGQEIDKIACSEFWKAKDSYRKLQDAYYEYIRNHHFEVERGIESDRIHLSVKDYKEVTNFEKTEKVLKDTLLELTEMPEVKDIRKFMINRDEKIQNEIIKPRDDLIQELYKDNVALHKELTKQAMIIDKAETFERERTNIYYSNEKLQEKCNKLEKELEDTKFDMKFDHQNEINQLNYQHQREIKRLKKQIEKIERILENVKEKIQAFIQWVCKKLSVPTEEKIIKEFENDTYISFDIERQMTINNDIEKENNAMER